MINRRLITILILKIIFRKGTVTRKENFETHKSITSFIIYLTIKKKILN
jgi:hypothetical protein